MRKKNVMSKFLLHGLVGALVLAVAGRASAAPTYKIVHAFGSGTDGGGAWSSVTLDRTGNIYGATSLGGQFDCGIVFKLMPESQGQWSEDELYSFEGVPDGCESFGGVKFDTSGNLYGTTMYGGSYEFGTVFELMPSSGGWTETVIYSLGTNPNDGGYPYAGVILNPEGTLYGTTPQVGTAYRLVPGSNGWTETIIHNFTNTPDGAGVYAAPILDPAGNLYGTTEDGGLYSHGTVYELHPTAGGVWQERLYSFCPVGPPCVDGERPALGPLATDGTSSVYGTTVFGGPAYTCGDYTCGTIFRITRMPHGQVKESVLYYFQGGAAGSGPGAGVVRDKAGNLYGTTLYGGSEQCQCGVVYELSPGANDTWTYTVLHTFIGTDGAQPDANLTLDGKGHLYGTAAIGGPYGGGVVFEITP